MMSGRWSEKFLDKDKCSGLKHENEKTEQGKFLMENGDINEIAYTELIISIDVRRSSGKVVFSIIKGLQLFLSLS
jgi:hypothetical protein